MTRRESKAKPNQKPLEKRHCTHKKNALTNAKPTGNAVAKAQQKKVVAKDREPDPAGEQVLLFCALTQVLEVVVVVEVILIRLLYLNPFQILEVLFLCVWLQRRLFGKHTKVPRS